MDHRENYPRDSIGHRTLRGWWWHWSVWCSGQKSKPRPNPDQLVRVWSGFQKTPKPPCWSPNGHDYQRVPTNRVITRRPMHRFTIQHLNSKIIGTQKRDISALRKAFDSPECHKVSSEIILESRFSVRSNVQWHVGVAYERICDHITQLGDLRYTTALHWSDSFYTGLNSIAFQKCDRSISAPGPTTSRLEHKP